MGSESSLGPRSGAVRTIECRVLLGWMQREKALHFLLSECRHENGLSAGDAEDLWRIYRSRVEELPDRPATAPRSAALCSADWKAARQFRNRSGDAHEVIEFVRINPLDLQIHQLHVSTDVFGGYAERLERDGWVPTALLNGHNGHRIKWRMEQGQVVFELPHDEFVLTGPALPDARLQVRPLSSYVSVVEFKGRMILSNGYHRTMAWLNSHSGNGQSHGGSTLLFPVSNTLPFPDPPDEQTCEILFAPRAPLFGDFFDDRLALPVRMRRKKRYEMRVQVEMTGIDDEVDEAQ